VPHEGLEVDHLPPEAFAVQQHRNTPRELSRLRQRQNLEHLVQRAEPARKRDHRAGEMREPELAHEEVMELEAEPGRDVRIRPLLVRQADVEPDRAPARVARAAVRGLHDPAAPAGADDERLGPPVHRQRPFRHEPGKLARLGVVAAERPVRSEPGRSEEDHGLLHVLAAQGLHRLQVLRENAQRPPIVAVEKLPVVVRKNRVPVRLAHIPFHPMAEAPQRGLEGRPGSAPGRAAARAPSGAASPRSGATGLYSKRPPGGSVRTTRIAQQGEALRCAFGRFVCRPRCVFEYYRCIHPALEIKGARPMKPFLAPIRAAAAVLALAVSAAALAQLGQPTPIGEGPWEIETEAGVVRVSVLSRDVESPWSLVFLPDGDMLLTERPGRLRVIRDGQLDPKPIEGLPEIVSVSIGGLMGLALHPNFDSNRLIYF